MTVEFECDVCKQKKPKVTGHALNRIYVAGTSTLMVQSGPSAEPRYLEACSRCVDAVLKYIGKLHGTPATTPKPPAKPRIVKPEKS